MADRAVYGKQVLSGLADQLSEMSNCNRRSVYRDLCFYRVYLKKRGDTIRTIPEITASNRTCGKSGEIVPTIGS